MLLDDRLNKTKCAKCIFANTGFPADDKPSAPCSYCTDRPTRKKDASQFHPCPVDVLLDIHDSANEDSKYNY